MIISVEYVSIAMGSGSGPISVTLTKSQNTDNCVPFHFVDSSNVYSSHEHLVEVYFSGDDVVVQRLSAYGYIETVGVYVVEFDPAHVKVQTGTFALTDSATAIESIDSVDISRTAAFVTYRMTYNAGGLAESYAGYHEINLKFTAADELTIATRYTTHDFAGRYYVMEALKGGWSVQHIDHGIWTSSGSYYDNIAITSVDTSKSWIIESHHGYPYYQGYSYHSAYFSSPTNVQLRRQAIAGDYKPEAIQLQVIEFQTTEFQTTSLMEETTFSWTSQTNLENVLSSSFDIDTSIIWAPVRGGVVIQYGEASSASGVAVCLYTFEDNGGTVDGLRSHTYTLPTIHYLEAIQFPAAIPPPPPPGAGYTPPDGDDVNFDFANALIGGPANFDFSGFDPRPELEFKGVRLTGLTVPN